MIKFFIQEIKKGGVLVFFSSYAKLNLYKDKFQQFGNILQLFLLDNDIKPFTETHDHNKFKQDLLLYKEQINSKKKALFFGVAGGKLTEGINFTDDLARCILIAGLPYENLGDP